MAEGAMDLLLAGAAASLGAGGQGLGLGLGLCGDQQGEQGEGGEEQ